MKSSAAALMVPPTANRRELRQEVNLPRKPSCNGGNNRLAHIRHHAVWVHRNLPNVPGQSGPCTGARQVTGKNKKRRRSGRRREHRRSFHARPREEERISRSTYPNHKVVRGILGGGTQGGGESAATVYECLREEERDIRFRVSLARDAVSRLQCFRPQARPMQAQGPPAPGHPDREASAGFCGTSDSRRYAGKTGSQRR